MGKSSLAWLVCGLVVAGCEPPPVEPPPPDPEPTPDPIPTTLSPFAPCGDPFFDGFECASLTLQLDPDDPAEGPAVLPVVMARVADPTARRGVLVFHPGGPGIPLLDSLPLLVDRLFEVVPDVVEAWDIAVLDTPGIGGSDPLIACEPESFDAVSTIPPRAGSPADVDAAAAIMTAMAEGCIDASGESLLRSASAFGAARAVDELRAALGEETIAFMGASYGTLVGAAYAHTYPDHLSALILDGSLAPEVDPIARVPFEAASQSRALDAFFAWCGATTACALFSPEGAAGVAATFDDLVAAADAAPIGGALDGSAVIELTRSFLDGGSYRATAALLQDLKEGAFDPALLGGGFPEQEAWANMAMIGGDFHAAAGATLADHYAAMDAAAVAHPRARPFGAPWVLVWPVPRVTPVIDVPRAAPTLVVGGALDTATPIEDTPAMAAVFGEATTLVSDNPGHVQLFASQCVAHAVGQLLMTGSTATTACGDERNALSLTPAGQVTSAFVVDDASTRTVESGPGTFVADAMRAATGTTIAMMNVGAMQRGSGLPSRFQLAARGEGPFALVEADFYDLLPFGGVAVTRTVTPAELYATLEHGVALLPSPTNALVMPSGFSYVVDLTQAAGARITGVTLDDGTPLGRDDATTAITATLDSFMAGGNGGFTMLAGVPTTYVAHVAALAAAHAATVGEVPTASPGRITQP